MGLRDRLKRLQRAADKNLETMRCTGCGETFKVPADTLLSLMVVEWAAGVRERGGELVAAEEERVDALHTRRFKVLEEHLEHGELYEPSGKRAWPPGVSA